MNTFWILILFGHVGPMGDGNSNTLTTARFTTKERCIAAGNAARGLSTGSTKKIEFVCVIQ